MSSRLERLVSLDAHIRSGVLPGVEQLCRLFEVQPRTIYQDLKELRERFGLDIRFDRERNGYYNASPDKRLPSMAMTDEEVLLLIVASELLSFHGGPSFRGGLANAIQRIVSDRDNNLSAIVQQLVHFSGDSDSISRTLFLSLLQACVKAKPITVTYTEPESGSTSDFSIIPKSIQHASQWKLEAVLVDSQQPVLWSLSRIELLESVDQSDSVTAKV